ncbi:alkaline phosphatase D family protein [Salipiger sp. PrR002]|uniref:alkaline phosphatase D family protein n=1 Tax=Salipiger sp. PrR002 TaxID=2706489 RepID=UPI0013BE7F82|nr:alkaline phosphatase D family protein [Salipiger sp. PrR002]NDV99929.1 alkaline phosphatase family protein [Salipiger sp. PrR002]NDW56278.1 alkaline phosphatase family protein [Salipiger sp. PrR004]
MSSFPDRIGPILYFRAAEADALRVAALVVRPEGEPPGEMLAGGISVAPLPLAACEGRQLWRYDLTLPQDAPHYSFEGTERRVQADLSGDLRIAFVSCNGEEHGDLGRDAEERNAMWQRLLGQHRDSAFGLMLMGGDQIYADEATDGHPLSDEWPDDIPETPTPAQLADLERHLRARFYERYLSTFSAPGFSEVSAEVPALCVWDDHDICDGWGSLHRDATRSAVGQLLFRVARETYLLFQHAAREEDVPQLFLDPEGRSLSWRHELPGLTLFGPDLRSERGRRQVMGAPGWQGVTETEGGPHTFLVSSVPLLGPRLSLIEGLMMAIPKMQKYEDDLRDQWQSRAHRDEWRRMLSEVLRMRRAGPVTVLSGEIHLATRAEMGAGAHLIHQLVASGISHRAPPRAYALGLGTLAGLGEAPLPEHPIRIRPLPGQSTRYAAERNYLRLERRSGQWRAIWELEGSGPTPAMAL